MRTGTLRHWGALAACAWLPLAAADAPPSGTAPRLTAAPALTAPAMPAPAAAAGAAIVAITAMADMADMADAADLDGAVPDGFGAPADAAQLEQLRGGSDTVWNDMQLSGTVAGNSAFQVVSGANIVSDGAFSNASGLPMVIQNSGANVLIQSATIINIQLK